MVKLFARTPSGPSFIEFFGDISLRLLQIDDAAPRPSIEAIMQDIGERYSLDRVHLRWAPSPSQDSENGEFKLVAGWQRGDTGPGKVFTAQEVPWISARIRAGEPICVNNLDEFPPEAAADRMALEARGIHTALILGLTLDADTVGAFTLSTTRPFAWSDKLQHELTCLASLLTNHYWNINNRVRLRQSEARYRAVVQDQTDFILRWTPDRTTTWVNDRLCEYLGKSREELIGGSELLFMTEDEWHEFEKDLPMLTPEHPTFETSHQWARPGGDTAWTEWTERGIFDDAGKLVEVQSVGRDITERKLADAQLQRDAAFQARLAEISSRLLGASALEINKVIAEIEAKVGADYGLDRVAIAWYEGALPGFGEPITWSGDGEKVKISPPDSYPYAYQLIRQGKALRLDSLDDLPSEARADRAQYEKAGVGSLLAVPLRIDDTVFGAAGFVRRQQEAWDDSIVNELQLIAHAIASAAVRLWSTVEIARREKDLARSQRVAKVGSYRLQATLNDDDSEDLLNVLSLELTEQALEIFDIQPVPDPRALVTSLLSRIHPDDEPRVRATWRKTLEEDAEHTLEFRVVHRDGSIVYVQAKEQFDGKDSNGVISFFGTYEDITEWVEANRELRAAFARIEELKDQLQEENVLLRDEVRAAHGFDKIIGSSEKLRRVLEAVRQVAPTDVAVLICGETGTGKELIARSIHDLSDRKTKPMVSVNCAALSAELIESELFGHEKGAFTGAHARRKGRFEVANGGTLFLDEIGELSGDLQAKLLRVIQEGEFERLGGSATLKSDVRIIAATNRNLVEEMDSGNFRADLFYRLNAFPIELPPLRDRKEDIPVLATHFVRKHSEDLGKEVDSISARTLRFLQDQEWPGNIRELESTVVRALIATEGKIVDYVSSSQQPGTGRDDQDADTLSLLDVQRKHIVDVLTRAGWVIEGKKGAASRLGLAPSSLRSKMQRLNIRRPN